MSYGITPTGFVRKLYTDIKAEVVADLRGIFGEAFNEELEPFKRVIGAASERTAALWELAEAADAAIDPDNAEDAQLVSLCALTGTKKQAATKSTVTATINLDATTTVSAGFKVAVNGNPDAIFVLLEDVTSTTAGNYSGSFEAEETGPIAAPAGTLTEIVSAAPGVNSVTNATDALLGEEEEEDPDLRARRERELAGSGGCTADGLEADLSRLEGLTYARVYENEGLTTDANGVPGKAFETVTLGGTEAEILQAIHDNKPVGIESHGTTSGTVTDAAGRTKTRKYTPASAVTMYATFDVYVRGTEYAGDDAFKASVVAAAAARWSVGNDVLGDRLNAFALAVPGVESIKSATKYEDSASPTNTANFPIARAEYSAWDVSRIVVTTTEATTD